MPHYIRKGVLADAEAVIARAAALIAEHARTRGRVVLAVCLALFYSSAIYVHAQAIAEIPRDPSEVSEPSTARPSSSLDAGVESGGAAAASGAGIIAVAPPSQSERGIAWSHVFESSLMFLTIEHVFRYTTESGTRDAFDTSFWPGYFDSVKSLHGWADGDPFLVNYVGHPMQGAVAGFMWQHNDRAYRTVEFGKNSRYWKAKLRGAAFAYVYSLPRGGWGIFNRHSGDYCTGGDRSDKDLLAPALARKLYRAQARGSAAHFVGVPIHHPVPLSRR